MSLEGYSELVASATCYLAASVIHRLMRRLLLLRLPPACFADVRSIT